MDNRFHLKKNYICLFCVSNTVYFPIILLLSLAKSFFSTLIVLKSSSCSTCRFNMIVIVCIVVIVVIIVIILFVAVAVAIAIVE